MSIRRPNALSSPTYPIIRNKVGKGGITTGVHVRKIQQLLFLAGVYKGQITGAWSQTEPAWIEFQKSMGWVPKPYVEPMDAEDRLAELANAADTLAYLPGNLRGKSAVSYLVDYFIRLALPYGHKADTGGTRKIWGFEGRPELMIFGLQGNGEFPVTGPVCSVNCTSFANLLLGAWHLGVHQWPYDSDQQVGGDLQQLGDRYMMPEVFNEQDKRGIKSLDYVKKALKPDRIYHMASCSGLNTLFTHHDVIILNGIVYQASTKEASTERGAVFRIPLERHWQRLDYKHVRLFGPSFV